jgi:hypothetical protein
MNTNTDRYNKPHMVVVIFEKPSDVLKNGKYDAEILCHENYYKTLKGAADVIYYGEVMNEKAVCVIMKIANDSVFEKIIGNDPALKSGLYKIKQVIPFVNQQEMTSYKTGFEIISNVKLRSI